MLKLYILMYLNLLLWNKKMVDNLLDIEIVCEIHKNSFVCT